MANWYVNNLATGGLKNGTSFDNAWTSFASISQSSLSGGDIVYVYPGSGIYDERYTISKGGSSTGSRIIYKGISGSNLPALRGIYGVTFSNIAIIGLEFYHDYSGYNYPAIRLDGASGWLIQDNYIHDTASFAIDLHSSTLNPNTIIRCNKFDNIGIVSGYRPGANTIFYLTNGCLAEYNQIGIASDRFLGYGTGVIIRNNYTTYTSELQFPDAFPAVISGTGGNWTSQDLNSFGDNGFYSLSGISLVSSTNYVAQIYQDGTNKYSFIGSVMASGQRDGIPGLIIRMDGSIGTRPSTSSGNMSIIVSPGLHIDEFQSFNSFLKISGLLIENNWHQDNNSTNSHGFIIQNTDGSNFCQVVQRRNVYIRLGSSTHLINDVSYLKSYNNTFYWPAFTNKTGSFFNSLIGYEAPISGRTSNFNSFINNSWTNTLQSSIQGLFGSIGFTSGLSGVSNHIFSGNNLNIGSKNITGNPLFLSTGYDGFRLDSSSILRGSGSAITNASGNGTNSQNLIVLDPYMFTNGWGVVEGDLIQITQTGEFTRITGIDYNTNTLFLLNSQTWNSGDGIWLKGTKDIGGRPYNFASGMDITNTTSYPLISGTNILSATTTTPDAIRKIEFLIDGIPMGHVCDAPYQINVTHTGGSPSIEARAYNMWASPILTLSSYASATGNNTVRLVRMGRYPRFGVYHAI